MNKKLIIVFVIFTVIGVGLFYFLTIEDIGTTYNTIELKQEQVSKFVEDVGRISSKHVRTYYGDGVKKIDELPVSLGDKVKKGDLLIRYDNDLDIEIKKVNKQIEALEASYSEVLSGTDMARVNNTRIEINNIKNELSQARKTSERQQILYNEGALALSELEASKNNVKRLENSLAMTRNNYSDLVKDISENIKKKYEAEIEILLLTLESLENQQDAYQVYAEFDGVVTDLQASVGDRPGPNTLILEIYDINNKRVLVDFMVEDAQLVEQGMEAAIVDEKLNHMINGLSVTQKYPKAFIELSELGVRENRQTVVIDLPSTIEPLSFGVEVNTQVMIESSKEAIMIPLDGIYHDRKTPYVKVLENEEVKDVEIQTGIRVDNRIEVKKGLKSGDQVIMNYEE